MDIGNQKYFLQEYRKTVIKLEKILTLNDLLIRQGHPDYINLISQEIIIQQHLKTFKDMIKWIKNDLSTLSRA